MNDGNQFSAHDLGNLRHRIQQIEAGECREGTQGPTLDPVYQLRTDVNELSEHLRQQHKIPVELLVSGVAQCLRIVERRLVLEAEIRKIGLETIGEVLRAAVVMKSFTIVDGISIGASGTRYTKYADVIDGMAYRSFVTRSAGNSDTLGELRGSPDSEGYTGLPRFDRYHQGLFAVASRDACFYSWIVFVARAMSKYGTDEVCRILAKSFYGHQNGLPTADEVEEQPLMQVIGVLYDCADGVPLQGERPKNNYRFRQRRNR